MAPPLEQIMHWERHCIRRWSSPCRWSWTRPAWTHGEVQWGITFGLDGFGSPWLFLSVQCVGFIPKLVGNRFFYFENPWKWVFFPSDSPSTSIPGSMGASDCGSKQSSDHFCEDNSSKNRCSHLFGPSNLWPGFLTILVFCSSFRATAYLFSYDTRKRINWPFFSEKSLRSFPDLIYRIGTSWPQWKIPPTSWRSPCRHPPCKVHHVVLCGNATEDAARWLSHWCSSCSQHMPGIQDVPYKISHGKMKVIWNMAQLFSMYSIASHLDGFMMKHDDRILIHKGN